MQTFIHSRGLRAILALGALIAASVAHAAIDTHRFDLGQLATTSWDKSLGLPKFDAKLGTLTSVSLFLEASISTDQQYVNMSPKSTISMVGTSGADFYLEDASDKDLLTKSLNVTNTVDAAPGQTVNRSNQLASASYTYTATSNLSSFVGSGSLGYHLIAAGASNTDAVGQWDAHYNTRATGIGRIEYTYTAAPVPEPASIAALGVGALGLLRRRKGGAK